MIDENKIKVEKTLIEHELLCLKLQRERRELMKELKELISKDTKSPVSSFVADSPETP